MGLSHSYLDHVVLLGPTNSGKSTIFGFLQDNKISVHCPTVVYQREKIETPEVKINALFDYGGLTSGKALWKRNLTELHLNVLSGIVYCVDCSDPNRFEEAKETLKEILEIDQVKKVPIVILGTRSDQLKNVEVEPLEKVLEIEEKLGNPMNNPELERPMKLFYTTISRKESIIEPFKWLTEIGGN